VVVCGALSNINELKTRAMKKLLLLFAIFTVAPTTFGQLNPVNNLEWVHWYEYPNNFFTLSWDFPGPSQDTVIGYNIYRNTELYRFQTGTVLYHTESGGNCGVDFVWFHGGQSFWIHVTAVYNSTQQESNYIDSAFCYGFAIGTDKRIKPHLNVFPNPTNGKLKIESESDIKRTVIFNQTGKTIKESGKSTELDLSDLPKGVYILKIWAERNVLTKYVIRD
jgi:hypothetical protein